jgi:hypothetical protein
MIHPSTELRFISPEVGHGVFATAPLPRGTITWVLDELDQVLAPEQVARLWPAQRALVERYAYVDAAGKFVLCWDLGRYVNHGCDPSTRGAGPWFDVAVRDIRPGEELTCDYAESNIGDGFRCRCGAARCRGLVRADDLLRHWQEWDAEVNATFALLFAVEQPLWPLVRDKEAATAWHRAGQGPPSRLGYRVTGLAP